MVAQLLKSSSCKVKSMFIRNILLIALSMISINSYANISLSTYRIFLNEDNRLSSFTVFNKAQVKQECALKFRHYDYADGGKIVEFKGEGLPDYSAVPWFRMSPKNFVVAERGVQKVTFSMRRKVHQESAEYRSIVSINCQDIDDGSAKYKPLVSLSAKLVFNIPLTVRVGEEAAEIEIQPIAIENGTVKAKLVHSGRRSVFGNFVVYEGEKEIAKLKSISIYPNMKFKDISIPIKDFQSSTLRFVFEELDEMDNAIKVERMVNL